MGRAIRRAVHMSYFVCLYSYTVSCSFFYSSVLLYLTQGPPQPSHHRRDMANTVLAHMCGTGRYAITFSVSILVWVRSLSLCASKQFYWNFMQRCAVCAPSVLLCVQHIGRKQHTRKKHIQTAAKKRCKANSLSAEVYRIDWRYFVMNVRICELPVFFCVSECGERERTTSHVVGSI